MINKLSLIEKLAQYTSLDKERPQNRYDDDYYNPKQQVLPFDVDTKDDMQRSQRELRHKQKEEKKEEQEQEPAIPKLNYPQLTEEQVRYRNLSQEDLERLKKRDEEEQIDRQKYWYGRQEDKSTPSNQPIYDLDKTLLPEDAKSQLLLRYNKFREIAAKFYECYKEANDMVENYTGLDYDKTYVELVKEFPKFLLDLIKKQIGTLFGLVPEGRRSWNHHERSRRILRFIENGVNIFNTTPETFKDKMRELSVIVKDMEVVMEAYAKRKKVLAKLPQILDDASKEFLSKRKNIDFLKWVEEYYPNDKKEFVESSIGSVLNGYSYRNSQVDFVSINDLTKIKSYKSIFEKAKGTSSEFLHKGIQYKVRNNIEKGIVEECKYRTTNKINNLFNIADTTTSENTRDLYVYCNKILKLDLKSIIAFSQSLFNSYYKDNPAYADQEEDIKNQMIEKRKASFVNLFIENLKTSLKTSVSSYKLSNDFDIFAKNLINKYTENNVFQHKEFSKLNEKDLDVYINEYIRSIVVNSLPNYSPSTSYYNSPNKDIVPRDFPKMEALGDIIKQTGKFTVDGVMTYIQNAAPFIPRDLVLHLARFLFKGASTDAEKMITFTKEIKALSEPNSVFAMKALLGILEKSGKLNPNSFVSAFVDHFKALNEMCVKFRRDLGKLGEKHIKAIIPIAIRSAATIGQDVKNLSQFIDFAHNEADDLTSKDLLVIFSNVNFHAFAKIGIVKKLISVYSEIRSDGGPSGIKRKYGRIITELIKNDYISKNFYNNLDIVWKFFSSNQIITPASDMFRQLFDAASSAETDLEIIEMGDTFKVLLKDYEKKDERLFNLNLPIGNRLRFSVLKDKDPRTLRIGIETNCCQRIGGAGESSAKDSFVNPLAGVVILEWKNDDGEWILLTQSYFHYVPADNSYILDNVEENDANVKISKVNIEAAYSYLANYVKSKFDVKYFLAGRGYSDIDNDEFDTYIIESGEDPRSFSPKALGYRSKVYTDFSPYGSVDLLKPKFDLSQHMEVLTGKSKEDVKQAFRRNIRKIILGIPAFA